MISQRTYSPCVCQGRSWQGSIASGATNINYEYIGIYFISIYKFDTKKKMPYINLFIAVFFRSADTRAHVGETLAQKFRCDGITYYGTGGK